MKKIIAILAVLLLTAANVFAAYQVDWKYDSNIPFHARNYKCATDPCQENSLTLIADKQGAASVTLDFDGQGTLSNKDHYAVFWYAVDSCYLPIGGQYDLPTWEGEYPPFTWESDIIFAKEDPDYCGSNVENQKLKIGGKTVSCTAVGDHRLDCGIIEKGTPLSFSADLQTSWSLGLNFIPDDLKSKYSNTINIIFKVNGLERGSEQIVTSWEDMWVTKAYTYTPTTAGEYILRIETNMEDDCKCATRQDGTRSNVKYKEVVFRVQKDNPYCGDGVWQPEIDGTCEYNAQPGQPGYSEECRDDSYEEFKCTYCGDGNLEEELEECDDGNNIDGDGCSAVCTKEPEIPEFTLIGIISFIVLAGAFILKKR